MKTPMVGRVDASEVSPERLRRDLVVTPQSPDKWRAYGAAVSNDQETWLLACRRTRVCGDESAGLHHLIGKLARSLTRHHLAFHHLSIARDLVPHSRIIWSRYKTAREVVAQREYPRTRMIFDAWRRDLACRSVNGGLDPLWSKTEHRSNYLFVASRFVLSDDARAAETALRQGLCLSPGEVTLMIGLSVVQGSLKAPRSTVATLRRLSVIMPNDPVVSFEHGQARVSLEPRNREPILLMAAGIADGDIRRENYEFLGSLLNPDFPCAPFI